MSELLKARGKKFSFSVRSCPLLWAVVWFVLFLWELERVINEQQRLELNHVEYFCPHSCTEKLPLRVDFIHRGEFGEVSGLRVLIKRGPGNRGPGATGISGLHSRRTRGDRHSSRVEAKKPALLSSRDGYLCELTGWTQGSQAS